MSTKVIVAVSIAFLCVIPLQGAEMVLHFQPDAHEAGPGNLISVDLVLDNTDQMALSSCQLFIGYDAALLQAVDVTWPVTGVLDTETFAAGIFDERPAALFSLWEDGLAMDVVSISGFVGDPDATPSSGHLCTLHFNVLDSADAPTAFSLDPGPYWTFSGFYDQAGLSLPVSWDMTPMTLLTVPGVESLEATVDGYAADLSWTLPAGDLDGIEIWRDGQLLSALPGTAVSYRAESLACGSHDFSVVTILGEDSGPARSSAVAVTMPGPSFVNGVYNGEAVDLSWTVPFPYAALYLSRNDMPLAVLTGSSTAYVDADLAGLADGDAVTYTLYGVIEHCQSGAAVLSVPISLQQESTFIRGDCNMDGKLSLSDAMRLLSRLFVGEPLPCLDAGDFDDSGKLQLSDAISLLAFLFSDGDEPAPPYDEPGYDPTPDALGCEGL